MPDARRSRRFPITGNCRIFSEGKDRPFHAIVDNINLTGIGIHRKDPLPLHQGVRIELKFFDNKGDAYIEKFQGKIIQVTKTKAIYLIGIAFRDIITEANHPYLIMYLTKSEGQ